MGICRTYRWNALIQTAKTSTGTRLSFSDAGAWGLDMASAMPMHEAWTWLRRFRCVGLWTWRRRFRCVGLWTWRRRFRCTGVWTCRRDQIRRTDPCSAVSCASIPRPLSHGRGVNTRRSSCSQSARSSRRPLSADEWSYVLMAYIVTAYIVMAYIVMACSHTMPPNGVSKWCRQ